MNYDDIINDCAIMGCKPIIDSITRQINIISVNPSVKTDWFEQCLELCEQKKQYLIEYNLFFETFNKLQDKERFILYNYMYRNRGCYELAKILKISIRTFFRLLQNTCNKYRKYRSIIYANNKISYPLKGQTKNY